MNIYVIATTYKNSEEVERLLKSFTPKKAYWHMVLVDDGSGSTMVEALKWWCERLANVDLLALPHGERGMARVKGIEYAKDKGASHLLFIDSDMYFEHGFFEGVEDLLNHRSEVGAWVIPERAFSESTNWMSRVKVFERNIINKASQEVKSSSIEAARLWHLPAYLETGGLDPEEVAFEEIQPTIKWLKLGQDVYRAPEEATLLYHDEKHVTLKGLIHKKTYYFKHMKRTCSRKRRLHVSP
jgi:glycosyltransferase involved in cell wall biosynthesis